MLLDVLWCTSQTYHISRIRSTECDKVRKGHLFPQVPCLSPLPLHSHPHLYVLVMTTSGVKDTSYLTCIKIKGKALITVGHIKKEMWLRKLRLRDQIPRSRLHPWVQGPRIGHCPWPCAERRRQCCFVLPAGQWLNTLPGRPFEVSFAWRTSAHFPHPSDEWFNYQEARFPGAGMSFVTKVQDWYYYFDFLPTLKW